MNNLKGLATGIGSLPFTDAEEAVSAVLSALPEIPFWPQLPRRSPLEGMIRQYAEGLPGFTAGSEQEFELFYERIIREDLAAFAISAERAAGLYAFKDALERQRPLLEKIRCIKGQITGPFTYAAALKDEQGVSVMHNQVFMQAIIEGLTMKALWQQEFFKGFDKQMLIFIDEPFLSCFGSAYTQLSREDVLKAFAALTGRLKPGGMLLGVHCCGNTDWSLFTDSPDIDLINFDAFGFLDKFALYAENVRSFLERGGWLCWGIVPTQEYSAEHSASVISKRLSEGIEAMVRKGVDKELLRQRLLISPSCGLGTLDPEKARAILSCLSELSALVKNL